MLSPEAEQMRLLGELSAKIVELQRRIDKIDPVLNEVRDVLAEQRGSRKLAAAIVTSAGVFGGIIGAGVHWIAQGFPR